MYSFSDFCKQARAAFPDLIVSVRMYERGSGTGGEVTMYRLSAQGQNIGAATLTADADTQPEVIKSLSCQVGQARRQVQAQRKAQQQAQRPAAPAASPEPHARAKSLVKAFNS